MRSHYFQPWATFFRAISCSWLVRRHSSAECCITALCRRDNGDEEANRWATGAPFEFPVSHPLGDLTRGRAGRVIYVTGQLPKVQTAQMQRVRIGRINNIRWFLG